LFGGGSSSGDDNVDLEEMTPEQLNARYSQEFNPEDFPELKGLI